MPRFPVIPQRTSAPAAFSNTPRAQAAHFGAGIGRSFSAFGSEAVELGQEIEQRQKRQVDQRMSQFDRELAKRRVESDAQAPPEETSESRIERHGALFDSSADAVLNEFEGQSLQGRLGEQVASRREIWMKGLFEREAQQGLRVSLQDMQGLVAQWSERVAQDPSEFASATHELLGDEASGEAGLLDGLGLRPEALAGWREHTLKRLLDAKASSDPAGLLAELETERWHEILPEGRRHSLIEGAREAQRLKASVEAIDQEQQRAGKAQRLSAEIGADRAGRAEIRRAQEEGTVSASQAEALRAEAERAEIARQAQQVAGDELALAMSSGVGFDLENPQNRQAADAFYEKTYSQVLREGAPDVFVEQVVSMVSKTGYLPPRLARDTTGLLLGSDEAGQVRGAELYGLLRRVSPDLAATAIDLETRTRGGVLNRWLEMGLPSQEALRRAEAELPRDGAIHALDDETTALFQRDLRKRLGNAVAGQVIGGLLDAFDRRYQELLSDGVSPRQAGLLIQRDVGRAFVRLDQLDAQLADAGFIWVERNGERVLVPTEARLQKAAAPAAAAAPVVAGGVALLIAAAAALSYAIQVSQDFGFDVSDEIQELSELLNGASIETKIMLFDAMPFMGEWFDQAAVELDSGEMILAEVVGYDDQVKERYLESRGPEGTYLVTQAFDWVVDGYVTRDITFNDDALSVLALRKKKDRKKETAEGKGESEQTGGQTAEGSKQPKENETEPKAEDADARRTKHIDNRHINRNKYQKKSQFKKPNQVDKLHERTVSKPDKVVEQSNGNIRYEKKFGREVGTKGQKGNVSVVNRTKKKRVTQFPQ